MNKNKNFTIMDLVIILAIVGVLIAVLVPILISSANNAIKKDLFFEADAIRNALIKDAQGTIEYKSAVAGLYYYWTLDVDEDLKKESDDNKITLTKSEILDYLSDYLEVVPRTVFDNLDSIDNETVFTITYIGTIGDETCDIMYESTNGRDVTIKMDGVVQIDDKEFTRDTF